MFYSMYRSPIVFSAACNSLPFIGINSNTSYRTGIPHKLRQGYLGAVLRPLASVADLIYKGSMSQGILPNVQVEEQCMMLLRANDAATEVLCLWLFLSSVAKPPFLAFQHVPR